MLTRHQRPCTKLSSCKLPSINNSKGDLKCYQTRFPCAEPPELYICSCCCYKTKFAVNLKEHSDTNHNLHSNSKLEHIESDAVNSKIYHCRNCSFQTYSLLMLLKHVSVKCTIIPEVETYADAHVITQSASSDNCFICEYCSYKTESNIFFIMHMSAEHNSYKKHEEEASNRKMLPQKILEVKKFRCRKCPYQTKWKGSLKIHTRTMHSKNVKLYKCKQCEYRTKWKNSLKVHTTTQHTESEKIKWFQCEHCPHKAKVLSYLKKHVLAKHTPFREIKWFSCEVCPYKTKWKANLKAHLGTKHKCHLDD